MKWSSQQTAELFSACRMQEGQARPKTSPFKKKTEGKLQAINHQPTPFHNGSFHHGTKWSIMTIDPTHCQIEKQQNRQPTRDRVLSHSYASKWQLFLINKIMYDRLPVDILLLVTHVMMYGSGEEKFLHNQKKKASPQCVIVKRKRQGACRFP